MRAQENESGEGWIPGAIGFIIGFFAMLILASSDIERSGEAVGSLRDCEALLPRNQTCHIIAVPEDKD